LDVLRSGISAERTDLIEAITSLSERIARLVNLPLALSASSDINLEVKTLVKEAIAHRGGLQISYHSLYKDETSERVVLPLEMLESQGYSYLHAYCFTALDFRHFRIDRIQSARSAHVDEPSTMPPVNPEKINFSSKVKRPTRDVAERFQEFNLEAGTVFTSSSFSQHWISRSVLAAGGAIELLSPTEIRSELAKKAKTLLSRYEG